MEIINLALNFGFESKTIEIADKFQAAVPGTKFKVCLFDSGIVPIDAVLAFHEIARTRPKGIALHIHSHVCLMGSELLLWLAGDTRTLRSDAWIHFWEYDRYWEARSEFQQFLDSLEKRDLPGLRTPFHENYLQVERLVKKHLPPHLLNRRVWAGELAEWAIINPLVAGVQPETPKEVGPKTKTARESEPARPPQGVPYTPRLL